MRAELKELPTKEIGVEQSKVADLREFLPRIIVGRADRIERWLDEQNVRSLYRLSKGESE